MKKVISILLILATLMSSCVMFFACKKDDDDTTELIDGKLPNKPVQILDISTIGLETVDGMEGPAAKWTVGKNPNSRSLTLDLSVTDFSTFKEVTFWMKNDSDIKFNFRFYFIDENGNEYMAASDLDYPYLDRGNSSMHEYNYADFAPGVEDVAAYPGWYKYSFPLNEVNVLTGSVNPNKDNGFKQWHYNEDTEEDYYAFDTTKIKITQLRIDASLAQGVTKDIPMQIGSIVANTNKYGTIKGFGVSKLSNAVAFYKYSEAYMYNQHRYHLTYNEDDDLGVDGESVLVPIAVLAQHRGATDIVATKEKVTFKYNGQTFEFSAGQKFKYKADKRTSNNGYEVEGTTSTIGDYLTVPMEVARDALGYKLFYDVSGLVIFSDRDYPDDNEIHNPEYWKKNWEKVSYVAPTSDMYYEGDKTGDNRGMQLRYIMQIAKIIVFDYYTGEELIADMNTIHGENSHGNLIISNAQIEKLKELVETDSTYRSWFTAFEKKHEKGSAAYIAKLPEFYIYDGQRMQSENASQIEIYAFLYRMTGNDDYAKRVVQLMKALLSFRDWVITGTEGLDNQGRSWHPEHFLDCAAPMLYYAIGYDWCYDYIAKDKNLLATIEEGAWEFAYGAAMGHGDVFDFWSDRANGIDKYTAQYKALQEDDDPNNDDDMRKAPWNGCKFPYSVNPFSYDGNPAHLATATYNTYGYAGNWNAVCNGGMIQIAFAFVNAGPKFKAASEYLLSYCVNDTTYAMVECYSPDGGHPEGPGYWYFGTKDQVPMLLTIANCTGSYHGLHKFPGFEDSIKYVLGMCAPNGSAWNYHDCGEGTNMPTAQFFAMAKMFNDYGIAQYQFSKILSNGGATNIWDLMFYDPEHCYENSDLELPINFVSYKIGMSTFRSDWSESALFAGLHGGDNAAGHGQLDVGAFILQHGDTRFFVDLGSDNYVCPGYFSLPARHWLYVNRIEGHNSLVINPEYVNRGQSKWGNSTGVKGSGQNGDVWACDLSQRSLEVFNYDQAYSAVSRILKFRTGTSSAYSVVDMGCAYAWYNDRFANKKTEDNMLAPEGIRGLLVTDNRSTVVIQDEFDLSVLNQRMKIDPNNASGLLKDKENNAIPYYDTHTVIWNGHIVKGGTIKITEDKQQAFITYNGMTLLCSIVVPDGYYTETPHITPWTFESRPADYLRETGLVLTPGEYSRDSKQKLVAITQLEADPTLNQEIKLAIVCRLVSAGPHNYTWHDIANWDMFITD